jgi:rhodanese-related sulfurtransferase
MRHFSVRDLKAYLDGPEPAPVLLDVREPWEFGICHIEGAHLLPMRNIPDSLDQLDRDGEFVVICHHGIRSRQVAMYMEHQGFTNVINMEGGMAAWARDVDPNMPTY